MQITTSKCIYRTGSTKVSQQFSHNIYSLEKSRVIFVYCLLFYFEFADKIYIIGHYNPLVRIIDLVSHTICVVYVNFIHKWRDLLFKVDSEWQIFFFEKLFMAIFIYSQSFCQKSDERKSLKKYFSYFVLMSSLGLEPWLFV